VVQKIKKESPYTHDLLRLEALADLKLPEDQLDLLDHVNDFNIRARYPEHKLKFYKMCTKEYTEEYFKRIVKLYKKLCQELK
jgi:HEPN domain-containing protein